MRTGALLSTIEAMHIIYTYLECTVTSNLQHHAPYGASQPAAPCCTVTTFTSYSHSPTATHHTVHSQSIRSLPIYQATLFSQSTVLSMVLLNQLYCLVTLGLGFCKLHFPWSTVPGHECLKDNARP